MAWGVVDVCAVGRIARRVSGDRATAAQAVGRELVPKWCCRCASDLGNFSSGGADLDSISSARLVCIFTSTERGVPLGFPHAVGIDDGVGFNDGNSGNSTVAFCVARSFVGSGILSMGNAGPNRGSRNMFDWDLSVFGR